MGRFTWVGQVRQVGQVLWGGNSFSPRRPPKALSERDFASTMSPTAALPVLGDSDPSAFSLLKSSSTVSVVPPLALALMTTKPTPALMILARTLLMTVLYSSVFSRRVGSVLRYLSM